MHLSQMAPGYLHRDEVVYHLSNDHGGPPLPCIALSIKAEIDCHFALIDAGDIAYQLDWLAVLHLRRPVHYRMGKVVAGVDTLIRSSVTYARAASL